MTAEQRFCPLCNRVFTPGEAVLRCDGCGVLHHPACWVTNNGCSTQDEHASFPVAQAFGADQASPAAHDVADPGRSSFVPPGRPPFAYSRPQREISRSRTDAGGDDSDSEEDDAGQVIGAGTPLEPLTRVRRGPGPRQVTPPKAPRRYDDSERGAGSRTLPKVYGRRRVIDFWYIPAAFIVAAIVAIGVILGVEKLTDDGNNSAATGPSSTATASTTAGAGAGGSATASTTAAASPTAPGGTPGATNGTFTVGQKLTVTGTGDCLNVRTGPATSNDAIICVKDGVQVTVTGGPQEAEGYTWWKVQTELGEGWAAGVYLAASTAG